MTTQRKSISHSFQLLASVLALIIGVFFTSLGVAILAEWIVLPEDDAPMLKIFGGLLIIYGLFRLFRLYFKIKGNKNEEDSV
ncbi:MAG: hypothetical protein J5I59_03995 [Saprospiraceae bacterium]|nr:hypothetical protein [Saprospiraceae bacterium]